MDYNLELIAHNEDHVETIVNWLKTNEWIYVYTPRKETTVIEHSIVIPAIQVNNVAEIVNTLAHKANFFTSVTEYTTYGA